MISMNIIRHESQQTSSDMTQTYCLCINVSSVMKIFEFILTIHHHHSEVTTSRILNIAHIHLACEFGTNRIHVPENLSISSLSRSCHSRFYSHVNSNTSHTTQHTLLYTMFHCISTCTLHDDSLPKPHAMLTRFHVDTPHDTPCSHRSQPLNICPWEWWHVASPFILPSWSPCSPSFSAERCELYYI